MRVVFPGLYIRLSNVIDYRIMVYENGIVIYIAGIEIFNNSEIDNSVPAETRSSDVESLSEEIDRVVYKT